MENKANNYMVNEDLVIHGVENEYEAYKSYVSIKEGVEVPRFEDIKIRAHKSLFNTLI